MLHILNMYKKIYKGDDKVSAKHSGTKKCKIGY